MITLTGTYLAEQVENFKFGLVLVSFSYMEEKVSGYLNKFEEGRVSFFEKIITDNETFMHKMGSFLVRSKERSI